MDNHAVAVLPYHSPLNVLVISDDNLYLEGALLSFEHINVQSIRPSDYNKAVTHRQIDGHDVILFNGFVPKKLPQKPHLLIFSADKSNPNLSIKNILHSGRITKVTKGHQASRWLELDDVFFDRLAALKEKPNEVYTVLATSIQSPVAKASQIDQQKIITWGFQLEETDLVLRVGFPLILLNAFDWFSGIENQTLLTRRTGIPVSMGGFGPTTDTYQTLITPDQREILINRDSSFTPTQTGIYTLKTLDTYSNSETLQMAVNLTNPKESDIHPYGTTDTKKATTTSSETQSFTPYSLWTWMVAIVFILLTIEWWTYHQRHTA